MKRPILLVVSFLFVFIVRMMYIICMGRLDTTEKTEYLAIRMSKEDKALIEANASKNGFKSLSEFVRYVSMNAVVETKIK
jgi:hypothetical protein